MHVSKYVRVAYICISQKIYINIYGDRHIHTIYSRVVPSGLRSGGDSSMCMVKGFWLIPILLGVFVAREQKPRVREMVMGKTI